MPRLIHSLLEVGLGFVLHRLPDRNDVVVVADPRDPYLLSALSMGAYMLL